LNSYNEARKRARQLGFDERRLYQTAPDRYEYVLTGKGADVILVIQALAQVGDKWQVAGDNRPPLRFVNRNSDDQSRLLLSMISRGSRSSAGYPSKGRARRG
jgi:hypothetical protein